MSEFSDRLKRLRDNKGWTKTYVANHLGIKMQTYANYEYGLREPDLKLVGNIAKLYDVTIDYLLNGSKLSAKEQQIEKDLDKAIDYSRSFDGKPISDEDREKVKKILRVYFED